MKSQLLGYDALSLGKYLPTFRRFQVTAILLGLTDPEEETTHSKDTASYTTRLKSSL